MISAGIRQQSVIILYTLVMNPKYSIHAAQYFTATIYEWQPILTDDRI